MKKNNIQKILLLTAFLAFSLCITQVQAQTTPPVRSNFDYLTTGMWKLVGIDFNTVSTDATDDNTFYYTFYAGTPTNTVTITQNDSISDLVFNFADQAQKQLVISPGTPDVQTFTIDYIDDNFLVYLASYTIDGVLYNYRFRMINQPIEYIR